LIIIRTEFPSAGARGIAGHRTGRGWSIKGSVANMGHGRAAYAGTPPIDGCV